MNPPVDEREAAGLLAEGRPLPIAEVVQERDELFARQPLAAAKLERPCVDPRGPLRFFPAEAHVDESGEPQGVVDDKTGDSQEEAAKD